MRKYYYKTDARWGLYNILVWENPKNKNDWNEFTMVNITKKIEFQNSVTDDVVIVHICVKEISNFYFLFHQNLKIKIIL